jgi:beta-galactosidase
MMLNPGLLNFSTRCLLRGFLITVCLFFAAVNCLPQTNPAAHRASEVEVRLRLPLNDSWKFLAEDARDAHRISFDDTRWPVINVPHTWNVADTQDDTPGYRMGVGWYRKKLSLDGRFRNKRVFIYFEGANQVAEVFVNGSFVGRHKGGYTAFAFDITDFVSFEANRPNIVAVKVDNGINLDIPPSPAADFNLYGGIYRDVWLVAVEPVHLTMTDHASSGVYVDTPSVSNEKAIVRVRGAVINESTQPRTVKVVSTIFDVAGLPVSVMESTHTLAAGQQENFEQTSKPVIQPQLWSPDNPSLYSVQTVIYEGQRPLDGVVSPLGFRWFSFDAARGFSLNGKPYKLRGANRHQDYFGKGNAVANELQVKDMQIIKDLGFNCVLLAHYPQDPAVLEAADKLGLIVWEEIPVLRQISTTVEFAANSKLMLTEMIRQHYNHPSIMMWCYMNEIFLRLSNEADYVPKVVALAKELDALARKEDPGRITAIAANRNEIYNTSGLADIPQLFGWHMYFGWYYGTPSELGPFLDEQHRRYPNRKIFVSEYGADSDSRLHSLVPTRQDYSTEWAQQFHQSYLLQFEARPYLCGLAVWNAFDFGSETRGESVPHVNKKGLFTYDRQPKDVSYFFKASFGKEPVLHIATREWSRRTGSNKDALPGERSQVVVQPVEVYSNLPSVELFVNGKTLGAKPFAGLRANTWDVPFRDGVNLIEARGQSGQKQLSDKAEVRFVYRASRLTNPAAPFVLLAVDVGSTPQFTDAAGITWEADQAYSPGGWGYIGGAADKTALNVLGTDDDPLYRTFRRAIQQYRFDVPDGAYEIELRFVEPGPVTAAKRSFSVVLNDKTLLDKLDLSKDGPLHATSRTVQARASGGKGIALQFQALSGETLLSGIRIKRLP